MTTPNEPTERLICQHCDHPEGDHYSNGQCFFADCKYVCGPFMSMQPGVPRPAARPAGERDITEFAKQLVGELHITPAQAAAIEGDARTIELPRGHGRKPPTAPTLPAGEVAFKKQLLRAVVDLAPGDTVDKIMRLYNARFEAVQDALLVELTDVLHDEDNKLVDLSIEQVEAIGKALKAVWYAADGGQDGK